MGDYNKLAASPMQVTTVNGPLYLAGGISNAAKAAYEDWLEGRARKRVFELHKKKELDDSEFKQSLRSVDTSVAAGVFSWGGDAWGQSLDQLPGFIAMVSILARDDNDVGGQPSARKLNGRILTPEIIMTEYLYDPATSEMVASALKEIINASPNFLSPPVQGA